MGIVDIGLYWNPEIKSWMHFVIRDNQFEIYQALTNESFPTITHEWEQIHPDNSTWHLINYFSSTPSELLDPPQILGVALRDNSLYLTEWKENKLTGDIQVNQIDLNGDKKPYRQRQSPLFTQSPLTLDIAPLYKDLPTIREGVAPRWDNWKKQNIRQQLGLNQEGFTESQKAILIGQVSHLVMPPPDLISHHQALLDLLQHHLEKINDMASRTDFDRDFGLNPENKTEIRKELRLKKKAFYFNVLLAELNSLRAIINMEPLALELPPEPQSAPILHREEIVDRVEQQVRPIPNEPPPDLEVILPNTTGLIKEAVNRAYTNYMANFQGVTGAIKRLAKKDSIRSATTFKDSVRNQLEYGLLVQSINNFLLTNTNHMQIGTFAFHLIQELSQIEHTPWHGLPQQENGYDSSIFNNIY